MFELLLTSFPVVFRYFQLRRRGEPPSLWNMKAALYVWAVMAFFLFLVIFYFHPKTTAAVVPFRTVSVVAQTAGPVTEIAVGNGQRVSPGDLLFKIENSAQRASLLQAEAELAAIDAQEGQAAEDLAVAEARVDEVNAQLAKLREQLNDAAALRKRMLVSANDLLEIQSAVDATEAEQRAALAQLHAAEIGLDQRILAQRKLATATIQAAQVQLDFTEVRSSVSGVVTQLALSVGSPATTLVLSPAMVIIPDRPDNTPTPVIAGFSQVASAVLYVGMPVEVACEHNADLLFRNTIFPGRLTMIQPAVANGQVTPNRQLLELKGSSERGTVLAYITLLHGEHEQALLDGGGCIVQAYTEDLGGVVGHVVALTGVVKAAGLRLKVFGKMVTGSGLASGSQH